MLFCQYHISVQDTEVQDFFLFYQVMFCEDLVGFKSKVPLSSIGEVL